MKLFQLQALLRALALSGDTPVRIRTADNRPLRDIEDLEHLAGVHVREGVLVLIARKPRKKKPA